MATFQEFTIDQGSDATIELHLVDKNGAAKSLVGHTVTAKLKKNYNDSSGEATAFNPVITNGTGGIVTLSLTNSQTGSGSVSRSHGGRSGTSRVSTHFRVRRDDYVRWIQSSHHVEWYSRKSGDELGE